MAPSSVVPCRGRRAEGDDSRDLRAFLAANGASGREFFHHRYVNFAITDAVDVRVTYHGRPQSALCRELVESLSRLTPEARVDIDTEEAAEGRREGDGVKGSWQRVCPTLGMTTSWN
jgi:hypothetical protein